MIEIIAFILGMVTAVVWKYSDTIMQGIIERLEK
jgi:hypothetical protein